MQPFAAHAIKYKKNQLQGPSATLRLTLCLWLCRLPFLLLYFPGNFAHPDTESSVEHYFGYPDLTTTLCGANPAHPLDNHHPIVYTYLYGGTIHLGNALGSQNAAVFLFLTLQALLHAWLLAQCVICVTRHRAHCLGLAAVYALFPVYGMWATLWVKDSLYSLCTTGLILCLLHWIPLLTRPLSEQRLTLRRTLLTLAALLSFMASKNQCVYIVALITLCLPLLYGLRSAKLLTLCAASTLLFAGFLTALPTLGVAPSGRQEMLGTLFQQTARYVRTYPDDVTAREQTAIDALLPYDNLATLYTPGLQDPVKFRYRRTCTPAERAAYFKAWYAMGQRHPGCYTAAVWDCCSAYFHPSGRYPLFTPAVSWKPDHPELFTLHALLPHAPCGMAFLCSLPVVGCLFDMGFYIPLFLLLVVVALCRRRRALLLISLPCLWAVAVLIVSPANGNFRYVMPVLWHLPLLYAMLFSTRQPTPETKILKTECRS